MPTTKRNRYPTDVTNSQWRFLAKVVPEAKLGPNPQVHERREILNALLYKERAGCSWRMLPTNFPPWSTVWDYFRKWRDSGLFEKINDALREHARLREGRHATPSLAVVDSQSVKSANGGEAIGFDGNKRVHGRKRHIITDVLGLLIAVLVTAANVQDRDAIRELVHTARAKSTRLVKVLVDHAYNGDIVRETEAETGIVIEVTSRDANAKGFVPEPKRWVVEQSFGCNTHRRQLAKEYDKTTASSEAWFYLGSVQRILGWVA
jgi:putative transposase